MIADGYTDLPPGKLANVVTCLEMRAQPPPRTDPRTPPCSLRRAVHPNAQWYRGLFREIGEPYLWASRLAMNEQRLLEIIDDPRVEIYAAVLDGRDCGLLELDFRTSRECELVFFGLLADATGRGMGRWLMNRAIEFAWAKPIERFWVHTCTMDDPRALPFYIRSGFVPFKRQIEIFDDPRLSGLLPKSAAPDIPLL